jgi:hypothetical protein
MSNATYKSDYNDYWHGVEQPLIDAVASGDPEMIRQALAKERCRIIWLHYIVRDGKTIEIKKNEVCCYRKWKEGELERELTDADWRKLKGREGLCFYHGPCQKEDNKEPDYSLCHTRPCEYGCHKESTEEHEKTNRYVQEHRTFPPGYAEKLLNRAPRHPYVNPK